MTGPADPFARDDAAYVLGVLLAAEREAFEQHLLGCGECRARVEELRGVPAMLARVGIEDLDGLATAAEDERPPDTLLPGLLRAAAARRRRGRVVVAALAAVAAACIAALVIVVWPSSPTGAPAHRSVAAAQNFVPLVKAPLSANAVLTAKQWGTEIDLTCVYSGNVAERPVPYLMYAYDAAHKKRYDAGSWKQGAEVSYVGGTALELSKIATIDITLADGTPIMRLTVR